MNHSDFLADIIAHPDDIQQRLVYADWLVERDDPLGEFIRVQVELAQPCEDSLCHALLNGCTRCQKLRRRESALLTAHGKEWLCGKKCKRCDGRGYGDFLWKAGVPLQGSYSDVNACVDCKGAKRIGGYPECVQRFAGKFCHCESWREPDPKCPKCHGLGSTDVFHRGFPERFSCTMAEWCGGVCSHCEGSGFHRYPDFEDGTPNYSDSAACRFCKGEGGIPGHGPAIVAAAPCVWVEWTDAPVPMRMHFGPESGKCFWDLDTFPQQVRKYLARQHNTLFSENFLTAAAAQAALSRAAILWAHKQNERGLESRKAAVVG